MSVDLSEATGRVAFLESFPFEDQQPNIEAPSLSVQYSPFVDYNFADKGAFDTRWQDEIQVLGELKDLLKQGDQWVNMLYTYRSCSKALPQPKTADQPNKTQIYEATFDVLEPEIKKLKNFMYFQKDTIKVFCDHVKKLSSLFDKKKNKDETVPSETYMWYLIQLLDRFALLDALKNMKACLNNDFAFYRRAFAFLRKNVSGSDDQTQENHTLYLFLAHQNSITTNLKAEVQTIPFFDDVVAALVYQCARFLESERYLLPYEKHCLLRVIPYGLILMDGENNPALNVFKSKKIKISDFTNIFKKYPIVPLYGDMQIALEATLKRSPHFDEKALGTSGLDPKALSTEYELVHHTEHIAKNYNDFTAKFSNMINKIRKLGKKNILPEFQKEIAQTILQGFALLSNWSSKILQQAAYKYAVPNNDPAVEVTTEYERVVRFNYKTEEKYALVEVIGMIKGLASIMLREEALLASIIRKHIHEEVQMYVQRDLRQILIHATKKKKLKTLKDDLTMLRQFTADWVGGIQPDDPALTGKSKSKGQETIQVPDREVGPSVSQMEILRSATYSLLNKKKDLDSSHVKLVEDYYKQSYYFPFLLNYSETILHATDLGDLWYREFYLELSKRLQFPIDMSLPWILTDHILESKEPSMMEYVFYPLDLYNDSASRALRNLGQRFLYNELEAEVNLCFDQLIYKLSEQIFSHFKSHASSMLLDKPYRAQLELIYSSHRLYPPKSHYSSLLKQRHLKLLGRSIDINSLICQRMNTYLRQNIDYAISRFEASNITSIVELEVLLVNIRLTYKLLSEYFDLDPWELIFNEVNESTSVVSFHGRIVLHIIFEIVYDFAPNWNYNNISNRFVQTPLAFSEEVPREAMPKTNATFLFGSKVLNTAYAASGLLCATFFGTPHVESIVRLVGRSNLPLLISELLQNMDLKIRNVLAPYVKELMGGMPQSSKLPIHDYGTEGGYGYFQLKLKDIIRYPDLRPEVLQNFRELGNYIVFMRMCDQAMCLMEASEYIIASPFLGITIADQTSTESPLCSAATSLANILETNPDLAKAPSILRELLTNADKADKLYRPNTQNVSMFKSVLQNISRMLDNVRSLWSGAEPENGVMCVDSSTEFYRLWSGLLFVCCIPTGEKEWSNHELFGDALMWAACTIIHFLGQRKRFNAFDFSYHIKNVEESSAIKCANPGIQQFLKKVQLYQDINNEIFSILDAYYPVHKEPDFILHPPSNDEWDTFISENKTGAVLTGSIRLSSGPQEEDAPPPPPRDQDNCIFLPHS